MNFTKLEQLFYIKPETPKETIMATTVIPVPAPPAPPAAVVPPAHPSHPIWLTLMQILQIIAVIAPVAAAPFAPGQSTLIQAESNLAAQTLGALINAQKE